jgi:hypothetical protein
LRRARGKSHHLLAGLALAAFVLGGGALLFVVANTAGKGASVPAARQLGGDFSAGEGGLIRAGMIPRPILSNFSLLRSAPDKLPTSAARVIRKLPIKVGITKVQRLWRAPFPAWLLASERLMCLTGSQVDGMATVCASHNHALREGIFLASISQPFGPLSAAQRVVVGVVPDHVREVRVSPSLADSGTKVVANTFVASDGIQVTPEHLIFAYDPRAETAASERGRVAR